MTKRDVSITWRGREVENGGLRLLVSLVAFLGLIVAFVGLMLAILLIPVMVLLHPVFLLFGRKGTMRGDTLALDREAFRRRDRDIDLRS